MTRMIDKARDNLAAGDRLFRSRFMDSAASRAYYAAYQALSWVLKNAGERPDREKNGRRYWGHETVAERARTCADVAMTPMDVSDYADVLLANRIVADYLEDSVPEPVCRLCLQIAEDLVRKSEESHHE